MGSGNVDNSEKLGLTISECVKSFKAKVESILRIVDRRDKYGVPSDRIRQLPARSALWAIPASDRRSTADVGEIGDATECGVTACKAIRAVGACDNVHTSPGIIVSLVVACTDCECSTSEEESGEDGRELHDDDDDGLLLVYVREEDQGGRLG